MNAFKKSLIVAASFASLSLFNSAVADMVYKPVEQPVEPVKPDLKIESVNEKFAEKYPNQYNSWRSTANGKGEKIIYADEENPRLIVLWGGYSFAKEYNAPRGHFYAVTDVFVAFYVLVHPKQQMMAHNQWHVGHVKALMFHV